METFGGFHPELVKLIRMLVKKQGNKLPTQLQRVSWTIATFEAAVTQDISYALHIHVARHISNRRHIGLSKTLKEAARDELLATKHATPPAAARAPVGACTPAHPGAMLA